MSRVHVMSDALASQVAAGEVVERPASVIKELVENSIDAGAKTITIDIRRGGIALMRVTDDGSGMSREDACLALQRHATSKIRNLTDLLEITQMGFRGEALPSIAGVSRLKLSTREKNSVEGTELLVDAGEVKEVKSSGIAYGTSIEIRELFYNIPARRKFLKSEDTEAAQAEHQIRLHALAFPEIRFILRRDDRPIYDIPGTQDWRVRISQLSGSGLAEKLIAIPETLGPGINVTGYLLPISEARRSRKQQFVFLNKRPIDDPLIARAIRDGYSGFPTGMHPALYLNIEIEPSLVDVNVHPAKKEVRFSRPNDVVATIMRAVSEGFAREVGRATPTLNSTPVAEIIPAERPKEINPSGIKSHAAPARNVDKAERQREPHVPVAIPLPVSPRIAHTPDLALDVMKSKKEVRPASPPVPETKKTLPVKTDTGKTPLPFKLLAQLKGGLFVWEGPEGLVIMHPQAARERILFEKFRSINKEGEIPAQQLLVPIILEMDVRDFDILKQLTPLFDEAGFIIRPFGRNTVQVDSIPAFLEPLQAKSFLMELVDRLSDNAFARKARSLTYEAFSSELAARASRKESFSPENALNLLEELLACELPYCTPRNKPTLVPISFQELNRKFNIQ